MMGIFTRKKPKVEEKALQSPDDRGWTRIFDWIPGAWQSNTPLDSSDSVISNPTVFACITLIASDIGKLRPSVQRVTGGIWEDVESPALGVLYSPNSYQNHIEFKEWWLYSKLIHGNTYALKVREGMNVVGLYLLDPTRVTPLISDSGDVFYQLNDDNLAGLDQGQVTVPANEIIHDRMNALFHPLVGLSPIYASSVAANQGLAMQTDSRKFFENGAQPSGVLTAPGAIGDETAQRLKEYWQSRFSGENAGNVAVVGDGLKYEQMRMSSVDAQLIEQFGWTDEKICSTFHVPPHKVGVGTLPTHDNIEALTQDYYSQCLQVHMEKMEETQAKGLGLPQNQRIELGLDGLFRMDSERQIRTLSDGVGGSIYAPNEARKKMNLPPLEGGDSVYLQQQNYSLEALAQRDATNPLAVEPEPAPAEPEDDTEDQAKLFAYFLEKELASEAA